MSQELFAQIKTTEGKKALASPTLRPVDFAPAYAARRNTGFEAKNVRLKVFGQYYIATIRLVKETMRSVWYYTIGTENEKDIFDVEMEDDTPFALRSRKTGKVYRVMEEFEGLALVRENLR